jgi:hypothetical protein
MPPMRKRSLWLRTPLFLLTLLQLSVPAAAALADASLGERTGPTHIESHSTSACGSVHPEDCVFHRFLAAPLARTSTTVLRIRQGHGIRWTPSTLARAATAADLTLPDSRAPPTLS